MTHSLVCLSYKVKGNFNVTYGWGRRHGTFRSDADKPINMLVFFHSKIWNRLPPVGWGLQKQSKPTFKVPEFLNALTLNTKRFFSQFRIGAKITRVLNSRGEVLWCHGFMTTKWWQRLLCTTATGLQHIFFIAMNHCVSLYLKVLFFSHNSYRSNATLLPSIQN